MEKLKKFDIVMAKLTRKTKGSVQSKVRPYVVVSNTKGCEHSNIVTVMALTSNIKKTHLPVHTACIEPTIKNGLSKKSMALGEMIQTISKDDEIICKLGYVDNEQEREDINKALINAFFYGEQERTVV